MITTHEIRRRLHGVNCSEVARVAGLSSKTIYRLRDGYPNTTIDTARRVMEAIERIEKREAAQ